MGYFISSVIGPRHPPVALHAMYYTRTVFLSTDTLIIYSNFKDHVHLQPTVQEAALVYIYIYTVWSLFILVQSVGINIAVFIPMVRLTFHLFRGVIGPASEAEGWRACIFLTIIQIISRRSPWSFVNHACSRFRTEILS
jgi:hypothetical protein